MPTKTIDKNVVEMQFDNSQFEKETKKTMSTIDKLKEKLNFSGATKGLDEIEKASNNIDFSGMSNGISTLSERFSNFGIIGYTVLQNLTNKVVDFGLQLAKSATIDQVAAGWQKMDLMTGSVQTLVNSTGKSVDEINGYLDKLMWYSDETSFGFTDMTAALATMTSSGGDIEKLIPMIEGIANATAYAGKGAAEFSRVIYNLNQSYSAGYLNYADWKSVQLAGVNSKALMETLIKTGEELGKIQKGTITVGNFTETLKKKWADTEVMEKAFNKFALMTEEAYKLVEAGEYDTASEAYEALSGQFDEIAERAAKSAQEAKTFKEAIDSVKDAVSSKWTSIFSTMFGSYDEAKQTWTNLANDLWEIFAAPLDNINGLLGNAFNSKWRQFGDSLKELGYNVDNLDDKFINFIKNTLPSGYDKGLSEWQEEFDGLIEEYGSLEKVLSSDSFSNLASKYISGFIEELDKGSASLGTFETKLESTQKIFDDIWSGKYGSGDNRIKALTEAGIDYATAQGLINKMAQEGHRAGYKLLAEDIAYLSEEQLINLGLTKEETSEIKSLAEAAKEAGIPLQDLIDNMGKKTGRQLLSETISNLTTTILNLKKSVGNAFNKVFNSSKISNTFYRILEVVNKFTEKIVEITEKSKVLESVFTVLFSVMKVFNNIISQISKGVGSIVTKVFSKLNISVSDASETIANYIAKFADWVIENDMIFTALDNVGNIIGNLIDKLKEWFDTLSKSEYATGLINGFKDALFGLSDTLKNFDISKFSFDNIGDSFSNLGSKIKQGPLETFKGFGENIGSVFSNLWKQIKGTPEKIGVSIDTLSGSLKGFSDNNTEFIEGFGRFMETIVGLGTGVGILAILDKLADSFLKFAKPIGDFYDALIGIPTSVKGVLDSTKGYLDALKNNINTNNIIKLAGALALLVGAFYLLATYGDPKTLLISVVAIGALMGVLVALSKAMGQNSEKMVKGSNELAKAALSIAVAVGILSISISMLKGMNPEQLGNSVTAIIFLIGAMTASMILLSQQTKKIKVSNGNVIAFAASILILAMAMKSISKIAEDPQKWSSALIGIIVCTGLLAGLAIAMSKFKVGKDAGLNMLLFAASLLVLVKGISKLASLPTSTYIDGLTRLIPFFGAFVLIGLVLKGAKSELVGLGATILAMASAMVILTKAIKLIRDIEAGDLWKAAGVMSALLVVLGAVTAIITTFGNGASFKSMAGVSLMILTLSASMFLLVAAIMILKNLDENGLWRAVAILSVLMIVVSGAIALMNITKMFEAKGIAGGAKVLTSFALIIGVLAAALFVLSSLDQTKLMASAAAMSAVMLSLSLMVAAMHLLSNNLLKGLAAIGIIGLFLTEIVGALFILNKMQWDSAMNDKVKAMMALILELSLVSIILSAAGVIAGFAGLGILGLLGLLAGLQAIILASMAVLNLINSGPDLIIKVGLMCQLIQALSEASILLSAAGILANIAGPGIAIILAGLVGLEAIVLATIEIASLIDPSTVDKATIVLNKIGEAIGGFFGGIISNFLGSATSTLPEVGANLSSFMENMTSFFESLSTISSLGTNMDVFGSVIDVVKEFGSTTTQASLKRITTNSGYLDSVKDFFDQYSEIVINFSDKISGKINSTSVKAASDAGLMMAEVNNSLPSSGGLFQIFTGTKSLTDFGKQMEDFAVSLTGMSNTISTGAFDASSVDKAKAAGDVMVELANSLPDGGIVSLWSGGHSLSDFGAQISQYAQSLVDMSNIIMSANLDTSDAGPVGIAKTLGDTFVTLASSIPEGDSLKSFIMGGSQDLGRFGEDIKTFVSALIEVCNAISSGTFTEDVVERAGLAAGTLKALIEGLPTDAGIDEAITTIGDHIKAGIESMMNTVIQKFDQYSPSKDSGRNTLRGLLAGLTDPSLLSQIRAAGHAAGRAFMDAYDSEVDVNSPSEEMRKRGMFTIKGLVIGLRENISSVTEQSKKTAEAILDPISRAMYLASAMGDELISPIITPVLDLSEIQNGARNVSSILSNGTSLSLANSIKDSIGKENNQIDISAKEVSPSNNYSFVQNNYSPKALSNIEIYRQTRNQFATMKGLVG